MIITKTPFRVTLGGGGTDLPSYYRKHGGFIFAMAIDKYMYVFLNRSIIDNKVRLHYTKSEEVENSSDLEHDLAREALKYHDIHSSIEISSLADIPAGTGLGSSSSYLVGLLNGIKSLKKKPIYQSQLADEACHIELDILKRGIGKQDQYMAAYGGLTIMNINKDGKVDIKQMDMDLSDQKKFIDRTHIYYTGYRRGAEEILADQNNALLMEVNNEESLIKENSLNEIKDIGIQIKKALEVKDFDQFGLLLNQHWINKKKLSKKISFNEIDEIYDYTKKYLNVLGGKIIGAGGGGFLMLYCNSNDEKLEKYMLKVGYKKLTYNISNTGSSIIGNTES